MDPIVKKFLDQKKVKLAELKRIEAGMTAYLGKPYEKRKRRTKAEIAADKKKGK